MHVQQGQEGIFFLNIFFLLYVIFFKTHNFCKEIKNQALFGNTLSLNAYQYSNVITYHFKDELHICLFS